MVTKPLRCIGRDGERTFHYRYEWDDDQITFEVHREPNPDHETMNRDRWFQLTLVPLHESAMRIKWIGPPHRMEPYSAKGIPDALIPEAIAIVGKNVASTSTKRDDGDSLNEYAMGMWERFCRQGRARWAAEENRYYFIPGK